MQKKKVLIVTESISYGGLNLASVRFQQYLDKSKFEFEYCVRRSQKGELEDDILSQGIVVHHVPDSELNYFKSYLYYKKLFKQNQYDIVHCHLPFFSGIVLFAAKQCGIKKRVAHAHFSQPYTDTAIYSKKKQAVAVVYRIIMRLFLKIFCSVKIACSQEAGEFLYGKREFAKNGIILNNGINTKEFLFDTDVRTEVRQELNIENDAVVLGHIGQLYSVKNQSFVIDVFQEFHRKNQNSYLLLIGDGNDREMLEHKISALKLDDCVKMLGLRNDANRLYQAMDCFIFPSLHEGFPLTLIEAQASKLPCVISDNVAKRTRINQNVEFLSIDDSTKAWCAIIQLLLSQDRKFVSVDRLVEEYDITNVCISLEKIYNS